MTKIIFKISIFIMVIGLVLSMISIFVLGEGDVMKIKSFYNEDDLYEEKHYTIDNADINSFNLELVNRNTEIKRANISNVNIKYFNSEYDSIVISEKNDTLLITNKFKNKFFNFFRWKSKDKSLILIEIPLEFELNLFISNTINGSLKMTDLRINKIDFKTTNGNSTFTNIEVKESLSSKSTNGTLNLENLEAKKVELSSTNGTLKLIKVKSDNISGATTNGTINLDIVGDPKDYAISAITTNGKITFNGLRLANDTHQDDGTKKISVKTTNGSININIK